MASSRTADLAPSGFIHALAYDQLPPPVVRQAQRCLLDLIGVAAAGSRTALSRLIRDHAADHFAAGGRRARMLFDGRRVSPVGAALAGATTIDAWDAHDGHPLTKGHAGVAVLPALLALTEAEDKRDGRELLVGLALGYEIGIRAGIALHASAADYHTSGAWNALACAALGARLLDLDPERTRHALGIAEYHGPRSPMMRCIDQPTMLKDGSGWGAMAGVSAAYLAASGFTGAPAETVEGGGTLDLWADLGHRWRILEQYLKPYPVCRWAQPAVAAALSLAWTHGAAVDAIASLEVTTFHEATRLTVREPATTEEAQYSLPFPVAVALVCGTIAPESIDGAGLADPAVLRLSRAMTLSESEDYNRRFPAERWAQVSLTLADGRRLISDPCTARGDCDSPLPDDEVVRKFRVHAVPLLGAIVANAIERAVEALAGPDDPSDTGARLTSLLLEAPDGVAAR